VASDPTAGVLGQYFSYSFRTYSSSGEPGRPTSESRAQADLPPFPVVPHLANHMGPCHRCATNCPRPCSMSGEPGSVAFLALASSYLLWGAGGLFRCSTLNLWVEGSSLFPVTHSIYDLLMVRGPSRRPSATTSPPIAGFTSGRHAIRSAASATARVAVSWACRVTQERPGDRLVNTRDWRRESHPRMENPHNSRTKCTRMQQTRVEPPLGGPTLTLCFALR
jgi:hypothetical protein